MQYLAKAGFPISKDVSRAARGEIADADQPFRFQNLYHREQVLVAGFEERFFF